MKKIYLILVLSISVLAVVSCNSAILDTDSESNSTTLNTANIDDVLNEDIDFADSTYEDYQNETYSNLDSSSSTYYIDEEGTYVLSGIINQSVVVEVAEDEDVRLVLDNVTITSSSNSAILIISGDDIIISAPEGTVNNLTDGNIYNSDYSDYPACIYSIADLTINGSGVINIFANYNNAIQTKDDLVIVDVTMNINSVDDGIIGRDSLLMSNTTITVDCSGDAIKATNDENTDDGYIYLESGSYDLTSADDGLDAVNYIIIMDGTYNIQADSQGIRSDKEIYILGGNITIDSVDDSINSNTYIEISGGDIFIDSGDDAIKADQMIVVNSGNITINSCYEGLESVVVEVNGGVIEITADDDGINAADGTSTANFFPSQTLSSSVNITINGGEMTIISGGDSIDSNGSLSILGGTIYAYGPMNDNSPYDSDGSFLIDGGTVIGTGSSQMFESPSTSSSQTTICVLLSSTISAGQLIDLEDESATTIFTMKTTRTSNILLLSLPELNLGESYTLTIAGVEYSITLTSAVTTIGASTSTPTNPMTPGQRPGR